LVAGNIVVKSRGWPGRDPEKVREVINACFDWLVLVVQKYDGTI